MTDQPGKKLLWHSCAPWTGTGYGVQTGLFAPRIRDAGWDVAISSTYGLGGDTLDWQGIPVYPSDDRWGNASLRPIIDHIKPDLTITLLDAWVLKPEIAQGANVACWTPVDHSPCPPKVARFLHESGARPIAMSRFGEEALRAEGLDPVYVPHGVDTNVFQYASNRADIRERIGLSPDAFVVGMVANNEGHTPPRKAFPQALQAFAAFRKTHDDAVLYMHSEMSGKRGQGLREGVNIFDLMDKFEIPDEAVMWTNPLFFEIGFPQSKMCLLYNAMDVLLSPSYGEGFGVPIIEAQACGTPVIVTNWTAMPELCGSGWIVEGEPWWHVAPLGSGDAFFKVPFVGDIIHSLEQAYEKRGDEEVQHAARAFALRYDADKVTEEYWMPALDALTKPREVPPLPNRAKRRADAKAKA